MSPSLPDPEAAAQSFADADVTPSGPEWSDYVASFPDPFANPPNLTGLDIEVPAADGDAPRPLPAPPAAYDPPTGHSELALDPDYMTKVDEFQAWLNAQDEHAVLRASQDALIIAETVDIAAIQAEYQADEARGNAVAALITGAGQMLATVEVPTEPEPEGEGS